MNLPEVIIPLILLIVGWVCTSRPTTMARLLSAHVNLTTDREQPTKSQEIARYVREHPEQWQQQYPDLFRLIQWMGRVAYLMFGFSLLAMFLSWLTHA